MEPEGKLLMGSRKASVSTCVQVIFPDDILMSKLQKSDPFGMAESLKTIPVISL